MGVGVDVDICMRDDDICTSFVHISLLFVLFFTAILVTHSLCFTCTHASVNRFSNTRTTSFPSSETGKIRPSSSCFVATQ